MNPKDIEREEHLQAAAERIERGTGTGNGSAAAAAPYRAVYRAIQAAPLPKLPADFAASMEQATRDHEENAVVENWVVRIGLGCAILGAALFAGPALLQSTAALFGELGGAAGNLTLAAALAALTAWSVDRLPLLEDHKVWKRLLLYDRLGQCQPGYQGRDIKMIDKNTHD